MKTVVGKIKGTKGLYLVELEEAGHFAADDQPESVLKLLELWLTIVDETRSKASRRIRGRGECREASR